MLDTTIAKIHLSKYQNSASKMPKYFIKLPVHESLVEMALQNLLVGKTSQL